MKIIKAILLIIIIFLIALQINFFINIYNYSNPKNYTQIDIEDKQSKKYNSFFQNATKEFSIPGLQEKSISQGICYIEKYNYILITAYNRGKANSVIFVIDASNGKLLKTLLLKDFSAHAGGITSNDNKIWISSEKDIYELDINDLINNDNMSYINIKKIKELDINTDYIYYDNNLLYIGEYNTSLLYKTNKLYYSKDKEYKSIINVYKIKDDEIEELKHSIYVPSKVQGIIINENKIIFSRSFWVLENSLLEEYLIDENKYDINNNRKIYYLKDKQWQYILPPESEEIFLKDNKIYINFESGSKLYWYSPYKIHNIYSIGYNGN